MKIVLMVHQSAEMYGSDKVLLFLAQGILRDGRYYPVVVVPAAGPLVDALEASGVEVHIGEVAKISRAIFTPFGLVRLARNVLRSLRVLDGIVGDRSVSVVHSNTLAVLAGAAWSAVRRKKHLWHVHEIILSPKIVRKVFPRAVRWLSDRVMSNSTLTEKWLLSEQPDLAPRSVVVFNGLQEMGRPDGEEVARFRKYVGAEEKDVVVTLAGRLNRMKGQSVLLEAVAKSKRQTQGEIATRFVIVGGPAPGLEYLPAELKAKAAALDVENLVTFIPFVDDIWPVWFGSDIAVVPSTEPESFGLVAIEAMAAGLPVVASGHGGILDIVVPEETGLLVTPNDAAALAAAIDQLANSRELRRELGRAGAERQRTCFSVDSQIARTIDVYEELAQ